mmetsp:Transcript_13912/g.34761  ORF Transcript_13912/g.34761 Transcript_13912/m.34761 type:complete len:217 (+) Transcript_13912:262-912(+)
MRFSEPTKPHSHNKTESYLIVPQGPMCNDAAPVHTDATHCHNNPNCSPASPAQSLRSSSSMVICAAALFTAPSRFEGTSTNQELPGLAPASLLAVLAGRLGSPLSSRACSSSNSASQAATSSACVASSASASRRAFTLSRYSFSCRKHGGRVCAAAGRAGVAQLAGGTGKTSISSKAAIAPLLLTAGCGRGGGSAGPALLHEKMSSGSSRTSSYAR